MKRLSLFLLCCLACAAAGLHCSHPRQKQLHEKPLYVNMRDFVYQSFPPGEPVVQCYADSTGQLKRFFLIRQLQEAGDSLVETTEYDSAFNKISIVRSRITAEGVTDLSIELVQLKSPLTTLKTAIDSSRWPWIQPVHRDSSSTQIAYQMEAGFSKITMHGTGHLEPVTDSLLPAGTAPRNCIKEVFTSTMESSEEVAGKRLHTIQSEYIWEKGKGIIRKREAGIDTVLLYLLVKTISEPEFEAMRSGGQ